MVSEASSKDKKYMRFLEEAIANLLNPVNDFAYKIIINDESSTRPVPGREDGQRHHLQLPG